MGKFTQWEGKAEMFANMGWTEDVMFKVGFVEVAIAILFLIPRTSFVAAILLAAYLGGAVATHVRVGDAFFFPIIIGVLAWIALGLREPDVFRLAFGLDKNFTHQEENRKALNSHLCRLNRRQTSSNTNRKTSNVKIDSCQPSSSRSQVIDGLLRGT